MVVIIIIYIALIVFLIAAMWKVFEKAGQPGWAAIIPIYSTIVMLKFVGKPWWWLLLMLIPIVNIVFAIWMLNMLSKSFGKDEGFTAGMILLGIVFIPILGFGDAQYQGPYGDKVAYEAYRSSKKQGFDFEQNKLNP